MTEKLHFFLERVGGTIFYLVLYSCIYQAETAGQFALAVDLRERCYGIWSVLLESSVVKVERNSPEL